MDYQYSYHNSQYSYRMNAGQVGNVAISSDGTNTNEDTQQGQQPNTDTGHGAESSQTCQDSHPSGKGQEEVPNEGTSGETSRIQTILAKIVDFLKNPNEGAFGETSRKQTKLAKTGDFLKKDPRAFLFILFLAFVGLLTILYHLSSIVSAASLAPVAILYHSACTNLCQSLPPFAVNLLCQNKEESKREVFLSGFPKLQANFPSQPDDTWHVIGSSVKNVFLRESPKPSVILLICTPESKGNCGRLVNDLATLMATVFDEPVQNAIHPDDLKSDAKYDLDMKLQQSLDTGHLAIIEDLHQLPQDAALLLHGYCNAGDSPYTRAVFIFTCFTTNEVEEEINENQLGKDILNEGWKLGDDKKNALLTRLTQSTVVVRG